MDKITISRTAQCLRSQCEQCGMSGHEEEGGHNIQLTHYDNATVSVYIDGNLELCIDDNILSTLLGMISHVHLIGTS